MPRRIRRPKDKSELLNELKKTDQHGVFETYKDTLVFAAALGFKENNRIPFEQTDEPIDWDIFKANDRALINMIALSVKKDLSILSEDEDIFNERLTIFEEYANGGLEILTQYISGDTIPLLDLLIDILMKSESEEKELEPLGKLVKELQQQSTD